MLEWHTTTSRHVTSRHNTLLCFAPHHTSIYITPPPLHCFLYILHFLSLKHRPKPELSCSTILPACLPACLPSSHPPFVHPSLSPFVPFLSFTFHTYTYITPAERHFITLCSRTTKSLLTPHITQSHYPPPFQSFLSYFSHFHPSLSCKYKYNQIIYDIAENQPLFNCNEICSFPALD